MERRAPPPHFPPASPTVHLFFKSRVTRGVRCVLFGRLCPARLSSTRIHSVLRRSTQTAAPPAAWGELYLITRRRLLHSDCLGSSCNDFRFLSDLYLRTAIHYLKLNASQNQEQGKSPSSEGVASPPLTSPEQHDPPEIIIPSIICDMPGCSATITLEHGTREPLARNTRAILCFSQHFGQVRCAV